MVDNATWNLVFEGQGKIYFILSAYIEYPSGFVSSWIPAFAGMTDNDTSD